MAAVLGLAAYIPECLMAQLMSDARLMQQVDVLTSLLSDKCSFLEKLSAAFWERLASVVSMQPRLLRDLVIRGVHTIRGYLELKIFSVVCQYPWCLAVGSLSDNVTALAALPVAPADNVAFRLWNLLKLGTAPTDIEQKNSMRPRHSFAVITIW
eukprot:5527283-Amphidinium_carterae.1